MSMSLRDQLLKAGLIDQKQANEAERQQQRQERRQPARHGHQAATARTVPQAAHGAKSARDQALNRQKQEKAERKARLAQIKQLIDQNRLPRVDTEEFYNFVDGAKVRRIAVNAAIRGGLGRGEVMIVRHEGRYDLVAAAIATRIRERDNSAVIASGVGGTGAVGEEEYPQFSVPDDLMW